MIVNYEVVKGTVFGEFLGAAFQETLRNLLAEKGDPTTLDMSKLDINVSLNGAPLDMQRVFSAFEKGLPSVGQSPTTVTASGSDQIVVTRQWLNDLSDHLDSVCEETHSVDSSTQDSFHEAACAAGSAVGEVAQEQAQEAASEYSPGSEANYQTREYLSEAQGVINSLLSSMDNSETRAA